MCQVYHSVCHPGVVGVAHSSSEGPGISHKHITVNSNPALSPLFPHTQSLSPSHIHQHTITHLQRCFEVEYEAYGQAVRVELVPGGADIPVTQHNRHAFVAAYTDWLLGASIAEQFAAFATGFYRVCGGPALSLFR